MLELSGLPLGGAWSWWADLDEQTEAGLLQLQLWSLHTWEGHTCCHTMKKFNVYNGAMLWLHWGILRRGTVLTCLYSNLHIQVI